MGVITEVTLKCRRIPKHAAAIRTCFNDVETAAKVTREIITNGIDVARIEMLDDSMMEIINKINETKDLEQTTLLIEITGDDANVVNVKLQKVLNICKQNRTTHLCHSMDREECAEMWRIRKEALWTCQANYPGKETLITDVCVPISKLPDIINFTKSAIKSTKSNLPAPLVAHAGDGNIHTFIMFDPSKPQEVADAKYLSKAMVEEALRLEGTCTGEHGVGVGKKDYLLAELGQETVSVMKDIKNKLDPEGLLNPKKIFK